MDWTNKNVAKQACCQGDSRNHGLKSSERHRINGRGGRKGQPLAKNCW
jgi:hypothetical protein